MSNQSASHESASPHVCVRCAAQGTSCCVNTEGVSGPPLTPGDVARIAAATGLEAGQFVVEYLVDAIEQQAWEGEDPATRGLVREGRVGRLARQGDRCFFLGEHGCSLGPARPLLCQRFPFLMIDREIRVKPGGYCLAVDEAANLPGLLILLGTSRSKVLKLDRQIKQELDRA